MCEVCNNRYNNCPACCDDGEPDNLEQPESEKNRPMPVASQETIDAMQKLYIQKPMTPEEVSTLVGTAIDSMEVKQEEAGNVYKYAYLTGTLQTLLTQALSGDTDFVIRFLNKQLTK